MISSFGNSLVARFGSTTTELVGPWLVATPVTNDLVDVTLQRLAQPRAVRTLLEDQVPGPGDGAYRFHQRCPVGLDGEVP